MFLWDGLHAYLSSNSIRVVGKFIHNLIFSWPIYIFHGRGQWVPVENYMKTKNVNDFSLIWLDLNE